MRFLTLLPILFLGARSADIKSDQLTRIQNDGFTRNDLDFIIGEVTDNSFLVLTERIIENNVFAWVGFEHETPLAVTRIEVLNLSNGTGADIELINGGLGFRHALLNFSKYDNIPGIDCMLNIYGERKTTNDFVFGELTSSSFLIDSLRITDEGFSTYDWIGNIPITRFEAIDQTNGKGGFIWAIYWFSDNREVFVIFESDIGQPIDCVVNIYGEPLPPNDLILGDVTEDSIVVFNDRITEQHANTFRFTWDGPYPLVRIEFLDESSGFGGEVSLIQGGLNETSLEALISCLNYGTAIDFTIILYADPFTPEYE